MCVIVSQPVGSHLKKKRARRLWTRNSDGGGFAYIKDGEIVLEKSMNFDEYWRAFETARSATPESPFMLHMRIATHGSVSTSNVHPFVVDEHTVMSHNGIIAGVPEYDDDRSDTRVFIDEVLPKLPETWLDDPYLPDMVAGWIGWSKLMFLTTNPKLKKNVYILNKKSGVTADKMWFSNNYGLYETKVSTKNKTKYTTKTKEKGKGYDWDHQKHRPKPLENRSRDHEDSADFQEWLEEVDNPKDDNGMPMMLVGSKYEVYEQLTAKREDMWLLANIYHDEKEGWMCIGCERPVHGFTGNCDCWSRICVACDNFAGNCNCRENSKGHLRVLVDEDDATQNLIGRAEWNLTKSN